MKSWPKIDGAIGDYVDANWLREPPLRRRLREETAPLPRAGMQISAHQGQQMALLARASFTSCSISPAPSTYSSKVPTKVGGNGQS